VKFGHELPVWCTSLNRIVIHLEGGQVQAVYSDREEPICFSIMDFDVGSGDEVFVREDGTQFIGQTEETVVLPDIVSQVFKALVETTL
jgi:hypothetical protein